MKKLFIIFALALSSSAFAYNAVLSDTNGVLVTPTNIFAANIMALTNALQAAGYSAGTSGGSAIATNDPSGNPIVTNLNVTFSGGTTGSVARVGGQFNLVVGSSNIPAVSLPQWRNPAQVSTNYFPNLLSASPQFTLTAFGVNSLSTMLVRYKNGCYYCNEDLSSTANGGNGNQYIFSTFRAPDNCTNVVLTLQVAAVGSATSQALFGLSDYGYGNQVVTNPASLGTSFQTFTFQRAPIDLQAIVIQVLDGSRTLMVSNINLTFQPAPTNPVLTGNFVRYEAQKRNFRMAGGSAVTYNQTTTRSWDASHVGASAILRMQTAATNLFLDVYEWGGGAGFVFNVYTNGVWYKNLTTQAKYIQGFDLPLSGTLTTVEVVTPYSSGANVAQIRAVLAPAGVVFNYMDNTAAEVGYFYGDSILSSINQTTDYSLTTKAIIENLTEMDLVWRCSSGMAFWNDYTADLKTIYTEIGRAQPNFIWDEMLYNDWNQNVWSGTNQFQTNLATAYDNFNKCAPGATIFVQLGIKSTQANEAAVNSAGLTLEQFRQAKRNIVNGTNQFTGIARTNYCIVVEPGTVFTTNNISGDSIHPIDAGGAQIGKNIGYLIFKNKWR